MDVGQHARMDMVFKAALATLTNWTKSGKLVWENGRAATVLLLKARLGEFEKAEPEKEAKGEIEIHIEFTEYCLHGSIRKVERFRFGVVIGLAWQVMDIQSSANTYDLFAALFRAAYDSVKRSNPETPFNRRINWNDILKRKWKISRKEIRRQAVGRLEDKQKDYSREFEQTVVALEYSYKHDGFVITK